MFDIMELTCYSWGHEKTRYSIFVSSGPGCTAGESDSSRSKGDESSRGGAGIWGFPAVREQMVWMVAEEREARIAISSSGATLFDSVVALAGGGGGPVGDRSLSGPVEVAICALDSGGGQGFD